jgi:3-oxoacyl-[acyl-carrier-protein] synthase-3
MTTASVRAHILGTGHYAPERVVTNDDLAKVVETSDEWIFARSGIRERRYAAPGESSSDMAFPAAQRALAQANIDPALLDMVVVGTVTPDMQTPSCAALLAHRLGATRSFAFDVSAGCAGSLFALATASQFIASGSVHHALVVGTETLTSITNWSDRGSCVLFGDGAGAMVLGATEDPNRGVLSTHLHTNGGLADILCIPDGGSRRPLTEEGLRANRHKLVMNGREVFKVAVRVITENLQAVLARHGLAASDLDHLILHQANLRIIEAVLERTGIPKDRAWLNIGRFGNTSSASMPIALDEAHRAGAIRAGQLVALTAMGAGMCWGTVLLRW